MEFTGERFVPSVDGDIRLEHMHRYLMACRLVHGKRVLDIASGEGYGSNMMSETAASVVGVDIDEASVIHARQTYSRPNVRFLVGSATDIPLEDATVDIVVSFETIEHLTNHQRMMLEIKRVLAPGGVFVLSSPDRYEFSDVPHYHNPHHLRELYLSELKALLAEHFSAHAIYGQRVHYASVIAPSNGKATTFIGHRANSDDTMVESAGLPNPLYFIAVAADGPLPELPAGIFVPQQPPYIGEMERLRADAIRHNGRAIEAQQQLEAVRQQLEAAVADAEMHHGRAIEAAQRENAVRADLVERTRRFDELVKLHLAVTVETDQLRADVETQQRTIADAAKRENAMRSEPRRLEELVKLQLEAIERLHASTSWRITAPLRSAALGLRRLKRGCHRGVAVVGRWAYRLLPLSGGQK